MQKEFKTTLEEIAFLRRKFHKNPELSFKEYKTQEIILEYLTKFNFDVFVIETGVIVYINLNKNSIIGFRAEMDALPINEDNDIEYKSLNNCMHSCGHDGHLAILLMLCKYIYENSSKLNNNYLMVFQPAEEKYGGSTLITCCDFFRRHLPKYMIAIHLFPNLKAGDIFYCRGSFLAMCCEIDIFIQGKSTHIYDIDNGIDSIRIMNLLISRLYTFFDKLDKYKTRFLIGKIDAGNARNIVSGSAKLQITLRNYYIDDYKIQKKTIESIIKKIEIETTSIINIRFNDDFAPVINDDEIINKVKNVYDIKLTDRKMIGDDFSKYNEYTKTAYFLLGIDSKSFLHTSTFDFNEKYLLTGLDFYVHLLNL